MLNWDLPLLWASFFLFRVTEQRRPHPKFIKALFLRMTHKAYLRADSQGKNYTLIFLVHTLLRKQPRCTSALQVLFRFSARREKKIQQISQRCILWDAQHRALACWQKMTASKFPRETARRSLPCASEQPRFWMCVFATNCHAPTLLLLDTAGQAAACIGLLVCCQSADVLHTFPLRLWGAGGCRLSASAEWNDCRLFFTAVWQILPNSADRQVWL